jgi:hypothetical protein
LRSCAIDPGYATVAPSNPTILKKLQSIDFSRNPGERLPTGQLPGKAESGISQYRKLEFTFYFFGAKFLPTIKTESRASQLGLAKSSSRRMGYAGRREMAASNKKRAKDFPWHVMHKRARRVMRTI